jgi:HEPN domain-containing protein
MVNLEDIREWLYYADNDYITAEHMLGYYPLPFEVICFHCQQAVEKWLKGFLVGKDITEPPKTHILDILCDMCFDFDERFSEIKSKCETLTKYAARTRYPQESHITELDTRKAFDYATTIRDFAPLAEMREAAFADSAV